MSAELVALGSPSPTPGGGLLLATVTQSALHGAIQVTIDGTDTPVTAITSEDYQPDASDRVLVAMVGQRAYIIKLISRTTWPNTWTAFSFSSPWANYSPGTSPGNTQAAFRREPDGTVYLKGLIIGGNAGSTVAAVPSIEVGTLGANENQIFPVVANGSPGYVTIIPNNGFATLQASSITNGGWVSLAGITYHCPPSM